MRAHEPLGAGSANVWTRKQAERQMSASGVSVAVRDGRWQTLWPGVFTDTGHVPDARQWAWAAVLASEPEAVACTRTAARLWTLPLIDDEDATVGAQEARFHDVAVARNVGSLRVQQPAAAVLHRRQLELRDGDVLRHESGVLVTSPARTLRDLAAVVSDAALVCAFDDALRRGLVSREELEEQHARAKGARHVKVFAAALALADPGAASPAETLARLLLLPALPNLRCQVEVREAWGQLVAVLDLADEELGLAVEVDGKRGHAGTQMVAKDRRRDRRTGGLGWHTERVTWFELRRHGPAVRRRVLAAADRLRRRDVRRLP